jgi:hypothetical protein
VLPSPLLTDPASGRIVSVTAERLQRFQADAAAVAALERFRADVTSAVAQFRAAITPDTDRPARLRAELADEAVEAAARHGTEARARAASGRGGLRLAQAMRDCAATEVFVTVERFLAAVGPMLVAEIDGTAVYEVFRAAAETDRS